MARFSPRKRACGDGVARGRQGGGRHVVFLQHGNHRRPRGQRPAVADDRGGPAGASGKTRRVESNTRRSGRGPLRFRRTGARLGRSGKRWQTPPRSETQPPDRRRGPLGDRGAGGARRLPREGGGAAHGSGRRAAAQRLAARGERWRGADRGGGCKRLDPARARPISRRRG